MTEAQPGAHRPLATFSGRQRPLLTVEDLGDGPAGTGALVRH
jgi:hypothetical protein